MPQVFEDGADVSLLHYAGNASQANAFVHPKRADLSFYDHGDILFKLRSAPQLKNSRYLSIDSNDFDKARIEIMLSNQQAVVEDTLYRLYDESIEYYYEKENTHTVMP